MGCLILQTSSVCPLIITKLGHLQWIFFWNIPNVSPFTYQTHDLIVVIQTETFQRLRLSTNKQAMRRKKHTERQREKGENSSVVHLADDILCTLSVISFSSARMDRISPLFLSGMTASLKSLETPFSSVSLSLLLSLFLSVAAIFLKLYELVTSLSSFLTSSLTFSSQPGREFNTCL